MKRIIVYASAWVLAHWGLAAGWCVAADFEEGIRPLLSRYCLGCHSAEKHRGDLDLEQFKTEREAVAEAKVWQRVIEQISLGEMPPKEKPQPSAGERERLLSWANAVLDEMALEKAGDPGPVVLRRLSNAEYSYTIRDLTGVESLDPAKEFPADSASGEGFMNVGNSLVMSPSLVTKYFDAAKEIAAHAVLLPEGIRFSPSTSSRDWTDEILGSIRAFYMQFAEAGNGIAVDLQGIKFDTKDAGLLPLEKYLGATLELRAKVLGHAAPPADRWAGASSGREVEGTDLPRPFDKAELGERFFSSRMGGVALPFPLAPAARDALADIARERGLSAKYLGLLWAALTSTKASLLLDPVREQWRKAPAADAKALVVGIAQWQRALWRFTTVGHIGKRDGPSAWQVPVIPLANSREVRLKIPTASTNRDVMLYLTVTDAGDGNENDYAVWENPRLVGPGGREIGLRDVRAVLAEWQENRAHILTNAVECLAIAAEVMARSDLIGADRLATQHQVDRVALGAWFEALGLSQIGTQIDSHLTEKTERVQGYDFIRGWVGADALSVLANSSDQHVRVPGNMKPHSVAVHPSPKRRILVGWRSPAAARLRIDGSVQHAHPECGNGVTWAVELRRGRFQQHLAGGTAQGGKETKFGPMEGIGVRPGDVITLVVGPRDGNHSCDLTTVELRLNDGEREWDLAKEVSPQALSGNPQSDRFGHAGVWHFFSEADPGRMERGMPAGSMLSKWLSASESEKPGFAEALERLLVEGPGGLRSEAPDAVLYRQLNSLDGPLLGRMLGGVGEPLAESGTHDRVGPRPAEPVWGIASELFGKHPSGAAIDPRSLCVRAPSVIEVRLPADLVAGYEFVSAARLDSQSGAEGSVQMQVLTEKPAGRLGLVAGAVRPQGGKSTWSEGERPVVSDSPILVSEGSAARKRIEADLEEFRQLFPAALCYTKIVPVDEVVTLTLFYREDDPLRRLMLEEAQSAELDRLWAQLRYVSQEPLKLVDAFEQVWQFATQDADPSAFTPMREPIRQRAETFKKWVVDTQPGHVEALLEFAAKAYRRPLSGAEQHELRAFYARLREQGSAHEGAIRLTLARVLVAPAFLYRIEKPGPGFGPAPVTGWELATRLSYFLWSTIPDAQLRAMAASGQLGEPDHVAGQARRMLRDPRVRRLAIEFACAWLHLYDFDQLNEKSERHFPTFTGLRNAMREETVRFFTDLFQRDGSVLDILDADYTFLNEELARHYEIPAVQGAQWRRVTGMKEYSRGGILGQAATLAKQSGASRTSPILRGNWVAEVLLGDKLPRPPKEVPQLPEDEAAETLTVRELTEKHSADPKCAGCHRRIDPYGYALEAFDAIGRRRDRDLGGRLIDTRARVLDGQEFEGLEGLRAYLLTSGREAFVGQFCRKLLGYALGRGVQLSDKPLLAEMRAQLQSHDYHISAAIETIVRSRQFREIRGQEASYETAGN